jgi:outer membrane receptor protein involved in Fe transport
VYHPSRLTSFRLFVFWLAILSRAAAAAVDATGTPTIAALLHDLRKHGIEVIYSSELIPADLPAPPPRAARSPLQTAADALATQGLALSPIAPGRYVVIRVTPATPVEAEPPPMEEISVYASRYAIQGAAVADPLHLSGKDIKTIPGSHDDALRALKALPGLASNASARPYIRGSLADDVLVRYDGITLLDPFHLKNFQSLVSAIDPAGVDRIEVFSGGFPVRYGTRSGGVIDILAPSPQPGYETRMNASLISAGVSSLGRLERVPVDWVFAIRRSTLDLLEPIEEDFGKPQFGDSLGRLRWHTEKGAWTLGWLLLDDRLDLGNGDDEEIANAKYRDEYVWMARDHRFNEALSTRATAVVTSSDRRRVGTLEQPGVAQGSLDASLRFDRLELNNLWTWAPGTVGSYTFGFEAAASRADYLYARAARYEPRVAAAFERSAIDTLQHRVKPEVFTYALHAAMRRQWAPFEAELGLRLDGQHYNLGGDHRQVSPRLNLRYDRNERLRLYASVGRFAQAQHVEEWRVEEAQREADAAQVSIHGILGLTHQLSPDTHWGLEGYTKRWTTAGPYFDNRLDPLALLPDLAPDRIRVNPGTSEASGFELSLRHDFSESLAGWGTFSWSRVADVIGQRDVLRSWDQPLALTTGVAWQKSRLDVSALAGWHRGWPRTPFVLTTPADAPGEILLGARNGERWRDFYTLDLRASYHWPLARGDFELVLEITNATRHDNDCCADLQASAAGDHFTAETDHWLPSIVNLGFTWRAGKER